MTERHELYASASDVYDFRTDWFEHNARPFWDQLLPNIERLDSALEIGSFEGNSACYLIDQARGDFSLTCVDSWEGAPGIIPGFLEMTDVEKKFKANTQKALENSPHHITFRADKCRSDIGMARLFMEGKQYDLVYVDANHEGWATLYDAVLAYRLCAMGGTIIFDDYTPFYNDPPCNPVQNCKEAIDAFVNLHVGRLNIITAPLRQFIVQKIG
jgi:predicted O-methyltransferase YrrM